MSAVKASMVGVKIGGKFFACEVSCSFNFDVDMIPTSPVDLGRWMEGIPGVRSWSVSVNMNLFISGTDANIVTVLNAVLTGELMTLQFRTKLTGVNVVISGNVYPKTGGISAANTGKAGSNVEFIGNGAFAVSNG